jgi:hypothetical protein
MKLKKEKKWYTWSRFTQVFYKKKAYNRRILKEKLKKEAERDANA